ncbi:MAG: Rrf2 family transcriptional regulator [Pseudomonadota bacterium]
MYTDYSLRVLLYLAARPEHAVTIGELADFYKISRNHLVKVVHNLGIQGFIVTTRGKKGGIRMARAADQILIGDVVRKMEADLDLLECFNPNTDRCVISRSCTLKAVMFSAQADFLNRLDRHTLADVALRPTPISTEFMAIPIIQNPAIADGEISHHLPPKVKNR